MNPLSIKGLIARYAARMRAPQGVVCEGVVRAYRNLGVVCETRDVSYTPSTRTITITARGPQRVEMLMRKHEVLTALTQSLRKEDIPKDIV